MTGLERLAARLARRDPATSTSEDDFAGRLLWALAHESGLPAQRFSQANPAPSLAWLKVFEEKRFGHGDLARFRVPPYAERDDKLTFSLLRRPTPYLHAPWMGLASNGPSEARLDPVMWALATWLMRHLDDPELVLWLAGQGGQLHENLRWQIERRFDEFDRLAREGKDAELDAIRAKAPNAIPGSPMRAVWGMLLAGRVKSGEQDRDLFDWHRRFERDGLTTCLRLELRALLAPRLRLREPFGWGLVEPVPVPPTHVRYLFECDLTLAADHAYSVLIDLKGAAWQAALPRLIDDFQMLLRDALELLQDLELADAQNDPSSSHLPSISPHWQNRHLRDWAVLIELLRDAWLALRTSNPVQSQRQAIAWFELPFPVFKRLAFYAAAQEECIAPEHWVQWLIAEDAWWLWSTVTRRETLRLLVTQGGKLSPDALAVLETAALAGPPRRMYREGIEDETWRGIAEANIWLVLAKLRQGGCELGEAATHRLAELSQTRRLDGEERDEFSHWTSGTGDPEFESRRVVHRVPRKRGEIADWLKDRPITAGFMEEDTWADVCRTRFFHCWLALGDLAQQAVWPGDRWGEALHAWTDAALRVRAWRYAAPLVARLPDEVLLAQARSLAWWLQASVESLDRHEAILLGLCGRVLALPLPDESSVGRHRPEQEYVSEAINHPVGAIIDVLLDFWLKHKPAEGRGLPDDIEAVFTQICDASVARFRHGRVRLARSLPALFWVAPAWAETHLLPLFDWTRDADEAAAVWQGFLWSPQLNPTLLQALHSSFFATAAHYAALGEQGHQYAALLTHVALAEPHSTEVRAFQAAVADLPQDGLEAVARVLSDAVRATELPKADYWREHVRVFWQQVWPKSGRHASDGIAASLAELCLEADDAFVEALDVVGAWLRPLSHPYSVVHQLGESGLCGRFPESALVFLALTVDGRDMVDNTLRDCLEAIQQAEPALRLDHRYLKLDEVMRRFGY